MSYRSPDGRPSSWSAPHRSLKPPDDPAEGVIPATPHRRLQPSNEIMPPSGNSATVSRFRSIRYAQLLPECILILEKSPHKSHCLPAIPGHGCQYDALNQETPDLKPIPFHQTADLVHGRTSAQPHLPRRHESYNQTRPNGTGRMSRGDQVDELALKLACGESTIAPQI